MKEVRWLGLLPLMFVLLLVGAGPGEPEDPLLEAAQQGNLEAVRTLIEEGTDVNAALGDGMTSLHWAAQVGNEALVDLLLLAGADVESETRLGAFRPIHLASSFGHAEVLAKLLDAGADPNVPNANGSLPLHFAAATGNAQAVAVLLDRGADVNRVEAAWKQTPLMWAAARGHAEVVRLLVTRGADATRTTRIEDLPERDIEDQYALAERVERLRAEGQDLAAVEYPTDRRDGDEEDVERPLTHHELIGKKGGLTAFHFAAREGHHEVVRALVEEGNDINIRASADNATPLLVATINGHFDLAAEMLRMGADPNLAADNGNTPLYSAIVRQWAHQSGYPHPRHHQFQDITYLEMMELLLEAGADPNSRLERKLWLEEFNFERLGTFVDSGGATAFWRAAQALDVAAMKLLVRHGADPHIPSKRPAERRRGYGAVSDGEDPSGLEPVSVGGPGVYPIHVAAGAGYGQGFASFVHRHVPGAWMATMRYLVDELEADVNARDYRGYNAVHHAASRGDVDMIEFLVERGADVSAVARTGQTTVDMANGPVQRVQPYPQAIRLLEGLGAKNNNNCVSC